MGCPLYPRKRTSMGTHQQRRAVSAFVGFSDDCRLFVFLVVILFVAFILVIIVVWVLRRQAHKWRQGPRRIAGREPSAGGA
jgi:flagellar biogenesis protein FliO